MNVRHTEWESGLDSACRYRINPHSIPYTVARRGAPHVVPAGSAESVRGESETTDERRARRTPHRASGRGHWAGDGGPREALWARYALVCVHVPRTVFTY
eukprot:scaffold44117_cov66-Phaeocystis_antarctica.AAC.2